ncbi:MAG: hypothetical protein NKF39_04285 [Tropheryma whipplei]|uniref:hypothetical protein n=1 Tax=Tropheryma whipplei TaxID=2039 RepID=UPI00130516A3|nr:hypothetical protein [Tropheryma whipplei]MCO8183101.1 hypothetical protein [Tropheryma whipplei]
MFSKHKCGYLVDLVELSESAGHRVAINGILQISFVAVFIFSGFIWSVFTGCDRLERVFL